MGTIRRRVVLHIELGADSWKDAADALEGVVFRLHEAREREESIVTVTSGGPSAGWNLQADEDPTITHDSYFTQAEEFLKEERQARNGTPDER